MLSHRRWVPWLPGKLLNTVERPFGAPCIDCFGAKPRETGWCHSGYFVLDWLFSWNCC